MVKFVQSSPVSAENARLRNLSEQQLVANLCELFAQIDLNGDGSMEWDEFMSFVVDTGLTAKSHQPNSIQLYHHVQWEDASKHSTFIDHVRPACVSLTGAVDSRDTSGVLTSPSLVCTYLPPTCPFSPVDLLLPSERRDRARGELQPAPQALQRQLRTRADDPVARGLRPVRRAPAQSALPSTSLGCAPGDQLID